MVLLIASMLPGVGVRHAVRAEDNVLGLMLREGHSAQARAGAATVLGCRRDAGYRSDLEGALSDQHPSVRAAAAGALGRIGSRSSLSPLHGVVQHDRVRGVVVQAREAIVAIERQPSAGSDVDRAAGLPAPAKDAKPRYGLILGEMRNRSRFTAPMLPDILGRAIARNLRGLPSAAVFGDDAADDLAAAQADGLNVFRVDGSVTYLSTARSERQLSIHCEVALLLMDRPSGSLRTLFKGGATGVEIPSGPPAAQELSVASRVIDAAVRSALRNADPTIAGAVRAE